MTTQREIEAQFLVLKSAVDEIAGADLPEAERAKVKMLCQVGLDLFAGLLIDINRIADAQEVLARTADAEFSRKLI